MAVSFFALTTRGLEAVTQAELARQVDVRIAARAYRRVHGLITGELTPLLRLRTADDVFLEIESWSDVRHTRDMLPEFTARSAALDLDHDVSRLQSVRRLPTPLTFAVTASFVGKRNYNYHEIKAALAAGITQHYPDWIYVEDDRDAGLNVRLFIEHDQALVGLRLAADPLHRRPYKQDSLQGSLKPPVAAAMVQLAELAPGQRLLDPFCGSGTIPIEAAQHGLLALGGDHDRAALHISRSNAAHAQAHVALCTWQAERLPLAAGTIPAVVSNIPWGRQIQVDDSLRSLYGRAYAELRRVLTPDGVLILLTTLPDLIPATPTEAFEVSVHGQNPQIMIFR